MFLKFLQNTIYIIVVGMYFLCYTLLAQEYDYTKLALFADKEDVVVKDVERDVKGFIWFIANGNIYRYDGFTSLNLQSSLTDESNIDDIPQQIYIDNENRLWISGINSLSYFDIDAWQLHKIPKEQLPPVEVYEVLWMKQAPNGKVFIAYSSGHVLLFDNDNTRLDNTLYQKNKVSRINIQPRSCTIWKDKLWIGTSTGALYTISLENTEQTNYIQLPNIQGNIVYLFNQENQLVVDVFGDGLYIYDTQKLTLIKDNDPRTNHLMHHGVRENKYFIAHIIDGVVTLFDKNDLTIIATMPNVLPSELSDIFDIYISGDEILVATLEGIFIFYPQTRGISSLVPANENKSVRGFYKFSDASIFYAGYGGSKYIDATGTQVGSTISNKVYCILPIDDSRLLLGTEGAFLRVFDRESLEIDDLEYNVANRYKDGFWNNPPTHVISLAEDEANYYIGSTSGLWVFDKRTRILRPYRYVNTDGLNQNLFVRDITIKNDTLLLSTHIGLLQYSISNENWKTIYPQEKIMGVYQHLAIKDTIWLATQANGVVGIDNDGNVLKTINTNHGLSDNLVYSLAIVNGYRVAGTNNGLSIIKGEKIKRLNTKNSTSQSEFNHGASYYDTETEQLYMGGLNGYTILDMKTPWFQDQRDSTSTMITSVAVTDDQGYTANIGYTYPYNTQRKIALSPKQNILQIYVGSVSNYKNEERLRYKLGENNDNWQDITGGQPISLTGLSPNTYTLFIGTDREIAENRPITLSVVKEPKYYQTLYFQVLIFMLLLFLLWLWFEMEKQKLKKEQDLRTKISADLHDDVGSLLTGISMQVEFLGMTKEEFNNDSQLKKISTSCKDAIRAMGDIVWSIDARNDNWDSLIAKLRQYAYHLFEPSAIAFSFDVEGMYTQKFSQQDRHAIYLIVKEALHNSKKHAHATKIAVLFVFTTTHVHITIKDNGKGFNKADKKSGQGLNNMKKRAESINASFEIHTSSKGTEIQIHKKIKNYLIG